MKNLREVRKVAQASTVSVDASRRMEAKSLWGLYLEAASGAIAKGDPQSVEIGDTPKETAPMDDGEKPKAPKKEKSKGNVIINPDINMSLGYDNSELMSMKDFTQNLNRNNQ